ncbi:MAG: adenylate/guanylate cyclase domain-containing protein [Nitriliruptorales bacterium]|nr:adenylate/guanylate cyclase domain-containing protein [Nitriliruptorales bacterium]
MGSATQLPAGEVTFLFSDIVGSTRRWEHDADAMASALDVHHEVSRRAIDAHGGWVVKDTGDGFMAVFDLAGDAVRAAVELQRGLRGATWQATPLEVRVGLHTGRAEPADGDYHSPVVNRCARVMGVAHGGQILATSAVVERCADVAGLHFEALGEHRLKDLDRAVSLHQVTHPGLPGQFPPLRSLAETPNNLPHVATPLMGRDALVDEVGALLANERLLTLTGAGGIGKTRLAYQVAAEQLEEFADGAWVVELGSTSEDELVAQVTANALRVPDAPGHPARERLVAHVRDQQLLMVIDNCEHLLDPVASLVDELLQRAPGIRVIATSREPLGIPAERVVAVPPLTTDGRAAAVRLFVDRAIASGAREPTDEELRIVRDICHRLDGLPLAIELAAGRARTLSVRDIADRLDRRFTLLTGGSRTALPRQRTLEATVGWSYDLLDRHAQLLLQRLSVFTASFTLSDVETVCTDPPLSEADALDLVTELVDRSLLSVDVGEESRYRLLETIRVYARERLHESDDETIEAIRTRHLEWAVEHSRRAAVGLETSKQLRWLSLLEDRLDDHRSAMRWALASGRLELGATVASQLYRFWFIRGIREGREWLTPFAEAADDLPEDLAAHVLFTYGSLLQTMGEYDRATSVLDRSVALYETLDHTRGHAYALHYLVRSSWGARPREEVRAIADRALAMFRGIEDPVGIGLSLLFIAVDEFERGRLDEGLSIMADCDEVMRKIGAPQLVAHAPEITAWGLTAKGEDAAAAEHFAEAIELHLQVRDALCMAHCLENVALLLTRHDAVLAAQLLGAMEELRDEIGVPVPPYEHLSFEPAQEAVEARFDESRLRVLWEQGRALEPEEALGRALSAVRVLS